MSLTILFLAFAHAEEVHRSVELGLGAGVSYISTEKEVAPSMHLHLSHGLNEHFSMGVGYEVILDEDEHHIVGIRVGYNAPLEIVLSYMLGAYINKEGRVSHHFEVLKLLPVPHIHMGIFTAVSVEEDPHYTLGVHLGF